MECTKMDWEKFNSEPLTRDEYLQTLKNKIVTSDELERKYNSYLNGFYGYKIN